MRRGKADTREKEKLTRAPGSRGRSGGRDQRQGSGEAASTAPEGAPAKSALTDKDRAATQLRKEANKLYGKGDFKAALECCKKADKDKPHDIFILTNLVAAAAASGDFPYAVSKGKEADAVMKKRDLPNNGDDSTKTCIMNLCWWQHLAKWGNGQEAAALLELSNAAMLASQLNRHDRFTAAIKRHKELRLKVESSGGRSGSEEEQLFSQGPGLQKRIGRLMDLYLDGKVEKDMLVGMVQGSGLDEEDKKMLLDRIETEDLKRCIERVAAQTTIYEGHRAAGGQKWPPRGMR